MKRDGNSARASFYKPRLTAPFPSPFPSGLFTLTIWPNLPSQGAPRILQPGVRTWFFRVDMADHAEIVKAAWSSSQRLGS